MAAQAGASFAEGLNEGFKFSSPDEALTVAAAGLSHHDLHSASRPGAANACHVLAAF